MVKQLNKMNLKTWDQLIELIESLKKRKVYGFTILYKNDDVRENVLMVSEIESWKEYASMMNIAPKRTLEITWEDHTDCQENKEKYPAYDCICLKQGEKD